MRIYSVARGTAVCLLFAAVSFAANQPQIIKLERFRKALWKVHVTFQGKPGDFLLDTGGGRTLFSESFAASTGCKFWGRVTAYNMFGVRGDGPRCENVQLRAGDIALTPVTAGKIDFGDRFPGDRAPDGLLSLDSFAGKAITLDQMAGTLTIETPESLARRVKTMKELPLKLATECSGMCLDAFVGVPISEGTAWLTLDSGAGGVSLIAKDFAQFFGLDSAAKDQRLKFEIADGVGVDSPVIVTEMAMDGNLGQPFLSRYLVTLDLARSRMWVAKAS
jgi:hypothetical protein